ncbi:hypothetical protein NX059_006275 [Plenodomus lindquistii]|nr:hypothetical protein NX059_006275 [Plenodomus lindquistii]
MGDAKRALPKADALFLPNELPWYFLWWQEHYKEEIVNPLRVLLPTAFEYIEYLEWMSKKQQRNHEASSPAKEVEQDAPAPPPTPSPKPPSSESPATQDPANEIVKAARCQHTLHPGHPAATPTTEEDIVNITEKRIQQWCPKCTLTIHVRILTDLWQRWSALGGPWRNLPPGTRGEHYDNQKQAFRIRKLDMVNAIDELDAIAAQELEWETAHPEVEIADAVKEQSASKTMSVYQAGNLWPEGFNQHMVLHIPPRTPKSTAKGKGKMRLSYSPGTPEDTRHRPNGKYARDSRWYDPKSPHACPNEEGWVDTALRDDWRYNVRQCRLLWCDRDPQDPGVTYRELHDEKSKDRLLGGIDMWMASMPQEHVSQWQSVMRDTSDIFLAWESEEPTEGSEEGYTSWDKIEGLVGSDLEAHALAIGEIDEEDFKDRERMLEEKSASGLQDPDEEEELRDDFDEMLEPDDAFDPDEAFKQGSSDDGTPEPDEAFDPDEGFMQLSSDPEIGDDEVF